ncbi:RNA-dependent RNA polymerase [Pseudostellaria heterophylla amalgavirus 1]|nr:RNA-dependent RNA polymerase [Pseudostellaria heterophylla amalgavirus 1]
MSSGGSSAWRPTAVVDLSKDLEDVLDSLAEQHFPISGWTRSEITKNYIPVKKFIEAARVFCLLPDIDVRRSIASEAVKRDFFSAADSCTIRQFYDFCFWLKSREGAAVVAAAQKKQKLVKKAGINMTVPQVALVSCLQEQRSEYFQSVKARRVAYDNHIAELRRLIAIAEEEREIDLHNLEVDYCPAAMWEEPNEADLNKLCWERYLAQCVAEGHNPLELNEDNLADITRSYTEDVRGQLMVEFLKQHNYTDDLRVWVEKRVLELEQMGERKRGSTFVTSWRTQVAQWLRRFETARTKDLLQGIVVGRVSVEPSERSTQPISSVIDFELVCEASSTVRFKPPISRAVEQVGMTTLCLSGNLRLEVLRQPLSLKGGSIPHARSKFESGVRKVIGGGEMLAWKQESNKYRGGGNFTDALKLLCDATEEAPGMLLHRCFSIDSARASLGLPCGLPVPSARQDFVMKNFNEEATAGPALRAFNVYRKEGLRKGLEDFAFDSLSLFAAGESAERSLPFVTARVGYRTKLVDNADAMKKIAAGKPIGRCVMMLDAHEQAFSTPLYNALSRITHLQRFNPASGFRNTIVRASSDWGRMWGEVREAACIVELDWSKFDRERPAEDIEFMIDVICSCFAPKNAKEERFLEGYRIMLRRALLERVFLTDDGGIFSINGMVPSGSLWTGWLDTALNILYIRAVLDHMTIFPKEASPKCAGDDNLTLFWKDPGDGMLKLMHRLLNEWFRAGIKEEDFKVHRPPFHVRRFQAVFPAGTDLSLGTSKIVHKAKWVEIDGEMRICEAEGLSHRWKYGFEGCPSFLSCYWLEGGNPIRPAYVNLEKLLFPEGIHKDIEMYEAAVISMVVDNPFNHHNINHLMHRYVIVKQVRRISCAGMKPEDILYLARIRPVGDEEVPFPMVAEWRRMSGYVEMERVPRVQQYMHDFRDFVAGVTSLYARSPLGGLDSWRFMDMIRDMNPLAERQFGNELKDWTSFLRSHPVTRYLRPLRQYRQKPVTQEDKAQVNQDFNRFLEAHASRRGRYQYESVESYASWLSDVLRERAPQRSCT